jgi:hypothetical protein
LTAALLASVLIAVQQNSVAGKWRSRDRVEVARANALSTQLTAAQKSVATLNSRVAALDVRQAQLKNQLSAVANAKEKAIDQNTLLAQVNAEAGVVAEKLNTCVNETNAWLAEFNTDVQGNIDDPYLVPNADAASQDCAIAQQDNQQLQTILGNG